MTQIKAGRYALAYA